MYIVCVCGLSSCIICAQMSRFTQMNFCQCPNALYKVHPSISMAGGFEGCVWCNMVVDEILGTNDWEICH